MVLCLPGPLLPKTSGEVVLDRPVLEDATLTEERSAGAGLELRQDNQKDHTRSLRLPRLVGLALALALEVMSVDDRRSVAVMTNEPRRIEEMSGDRLPDEPRTDGYPHIEVTTGDHPRAVVTIDIYLHTDMTTADYHRAEETTDDYLRAEMRIGGYLQTEQKRNGENRLRRQAERDATPPRDILLPLDVLLPEALRGGIVRSNGLCLRAAEKQGRPPTKDLSKKPQLRGKPRASWSRPRRRCWRSRQR